MLHVANTQHTWLQRFTFHSLAWGQLPTLSLTGACGLLLVALASNGGRASAPWADLLFWAGLLLAFLPIAARLLSLQPLRQERLALVLLLVGLLYIVKLLHYPLAFALSDEFQHLRTAQDILTSDHLFLPNPLLLVSSSFPGLEIVTIALSRLTGLALFPAGVIVVAVARLMLVLAVFLLSERLSRSAYVAGATTLLYAANPLFLFFGAQFAYESLAMPLATVVLWAMASSINMRGLAHAGMLVMALLGLMALTVTHHLASYLLVAFLLLWCALSWSVPTLRKRAVRRDRVCLLVLTLVALMMVVAWLVFVAGSIRDYLAPYPVQLANELLNAIVGQSPLRPLFQQVGSQYVPQWERLLALASAGLLLAGMPFGLYLVWRDYRRNGFVVTLAIASLLYPASLVLRFTATGENTGGRLAVYAFVPLTFLLALLAQPLQVRLQGLARYASKRKNNAGSVGTIIAMSAIAGVLFAGGVVQGAGQIWTQIPGPYIVEAGGGPSIDTESIGSAAWMQTHLGPGQRVSADLTNDLVLGTYGRQWVVTGWIDHIGVAPVFSSASFDVLEKALVLKGGIHYLVIDHRLSTQLPALGYYFDRSENGGKPYTIPLSSQALSKFDTMPGVSRLYDSGNITIYDMGIFAG